MATKTKTVKEGKKDRFNITGLMKEVKSGKVSDGAFKSKLTRHYKELKRKDDWIVQRTTSLLRKAHRTKSK
jgi:hypothetical protein